jgi:putrescine:ornithine antiporter
MNVVQVTFLVTVNAMGCDLIMLPTNMAQVGAISLLSWLVTAVGSMALAYGFRVVFLYFISIANVAVAMPPCR